MRPGARGITRLALLAAVLCLVSQLAIPMPWGMPLTLQTLGVALCGYMLGPGWGAVCVGVYLLLGAAGLPVFSGFTGGLGHFFGPTGGFLLGFLPLAALCGAGGDKTKIKGAFLALAGLIVAHGAGTVQFSLVTGRSFMESLALSSAPYILKDILSLAAAQKLSDMIKKRLKG